MGVTEIIDATVTLYRSNFALLAGVVALLAVPQTILNMIFVSLLPTTTLGTETGTGMELNAAAQTYATAAARGTGTGIIGVIFTVLITGALAQAVSARYLGRDETVLGAYADTGVGAFVRLFLALLLAIVALVALIAIVGILIVLGVVTGGGSPAMVLLGVLVGVAAFVLASYVTPHLYLIPQVIVLEGRGVFESIRRSWFLVHGSYWHVVGLVFLVGLMVGIISGIISGIVSLAALGNPVFITGVNGVVGLLLQPVSLGAVTLLYFDQRVRKEGFDLEYAAEHMALSPQ
jgi:hypothetical protein